MKKGGGGKKAQNSKSTIGMYLRNLRHVFNVAANELKIINKEKCYPFGVSKYRIPSSRNVKKAFDAGYHRGTLCLRLRPAKALVKKSEGPFGFLSISEMA